METIRDVYTYISQKTTDPFISMNTIHQWTHLDETNMMSTYMFLISWSEYHHATMILCDVVGGSDVWDMNETPTVDGTANWATWNEDTKMESQKNNKPTKTSMSLL